VKSCVVRFKLALSAAAPIWRGYLADIDCRWNVICGMVDDRTAEERGLEVKFLFRKLILRLYRLAVKKRTLSFT